MKSTRKPPRSHDPAFDKLLGQLLEQQASSHAYQRGAAKFGRLRLGDLFFDSGQEAIKLGYASHTAEYRLFREGFNDAMQDRGVDIVTDEAHRIVDFPTVLSSRFSGVLR